jgi:competence ComEA-like helix-hairpin-helix protein
MHIPNRSLRTAWFAAALGLAPLAGVAGAEPTAPPRAVNVNTATAEELEGLPGIGESRARAILEARKARGGFKTVDELVDVKGIGPSALEKLRPFLTIDGKGAARPASVGAAGN